MSEQSPERTAEAVEQIRKLTGITNSRFTLTNHTVGDVHVLTYDSAYPEAANIHFESDCPGADCPRFYTP